jgi:hypothetical protein
MDGPTVDRRATDVQVRRRLVAGHKRFRAGAWRLTVEAPPDPITGKRQQVHRTGDLLGHDGAEHVQLRGPAGGPHRGEHAGERREHDDDHQCRDRKPERLDSLV